MNRLRQEYILAGRHCLYIQIAVGFGDGFGTRNFARFRLALALALALLVGAAAAARSAEPNAGTPAGGKAKLRHLVKWA
ncbi:MAG TPA: hypothetical protein ENH27_05205 [Rhizobiales bacterium]|nr:hypothetical protein [Hyphomicrobiales bacterium]